MKRKSYYLTIPVIIVAAAIVLFVPVKLPYTVGSIGKIISAREWALVRGDDGQLITTMQNHVTGLSDGYSVSQFAREGAMRFSLHSSITAAGYVDTGDTVGRIYSSETEEQLAALKGQLATARAALDVNRGGEKESIIREHEQRLTHARKKAADQQKIVARLKQMLDKNLISLQEYEIAQGEANVLDIEITIAASQLEAARSGEKPEQVNFIRTQIDAFETDINTLQNRLESFSITTPIAGRISRVYSADTLLIVSDTSSYVAYVPITRGDYRYVSPGQSVDINLTAPRLTLTGTLHSVDTQTRTINGRQVLIATILITAPSENVLPGIVDCEINCQPVTILEYLKRFISRMAA